MDVVPRYRSRDELAAAPARLVTTMLEVLIAGCADGPRFRRGRQYLLDGSVRSLTVGPGGIDAEVTGSRAWTYHVAIDVALASGVTSDVGQPATLVALVPDADDVRFECTCPDWEEPCKHAVAAMLAFAAEAGDDPTLLQLWRGGPMGDRAEVRNRARGLEPPELDRAAEPVLLEWQTSQWDVFLGTDLPPPPEPLDGDGDPPQGVSEMLGPVDLGALVRDARQQLVVAVQYQSGSRRA